MINMNSIKTIEILYKNIDTIFTRREICLLDSLLNNLCNIRTNMIYMFI